MSGTGNPIEEFENTVKFVNLVFSISGSNMLHENWRRGFKGKVLFLVPAITISLTPICSINAVLYYLHEFYKLSEALLSAAALMQVLCKLIMIQYTYEDFRSRVRFCKNFRTLYATDINKARLSDKSLAKNGYNFIVLVYTLCTVSFLGMIISPLLGSERSFPLSFHLPIGPPFKSPFYEINFIFVSYDLTLFLHLALGIDLVFIMLVSELCLQFDVIKYKLLCFEDNGNTSFVKLQEIQQMYEQLSQSIHAVNKTFSTLFLIQFSTSFLMITMTLFLTMITKNYSFAPMAIAVITQLGIYCVCGEMLKHKVERFIFELYSLRWYNLEPKQKKSLVIMMSIAQVDLTLKAGGLVDLSLASYFQLLKTGYSFCAVMGDT